MSAVESMNLDQLIDQLGDNIDDLGAALEPFFKAAIAQTATKLPLLDRAKLYAIVTYSIESILFSYIRLNGSNAKNHPVFRELVRVKQYFEKIKTTEVGESKRTNLRLDQAAAGRFITHALAGNKRLDATQQTQGSPQDRVSRKRKAGMQENPGDSERSGLEPSISTTTAGVPVGDPDLGEQAKETQPERSGGKVERGGSRKKRKKADRRSKSSNEASR